VAFKLISPPQTIACSRDLRVGMASAVRSTETVGSSPQEAGIIMIETTPDEAFLLFEKWWSEKAVVTCFSSFFDWSFTFRGRLSAISRDEVSLVSLDAAVTLTVPLRKEGLRFGYAESEEASLTEGVPKGLPGLVLGLPLRLPPSEFSTQSGPPLREKLVFIQWPGDSSTDI
jgi:hypothetical protein